MMVWIIQLILENTDLGNRSIPLRFVFLITELHFQKQKIKTYIHGRHHKNIFRIESEDQSSRQVG